MRNIIERILVRTQKEGNTEEIKTIGLEIHEEFKELYLGKSPDFKDINLYYYNDIHHILLQQGETKKALKMLHILDIYENYIKNNNA